MDDKNYQKSEKNWYIFYGQQHRGPYDKEKILQWVEKGKIRKDIQIWQEGMADWVSYDKLFCSAGQAQDGPLQPPEKKSQLRKAKKELSSRPVKREGVKRKKYSFKKLYQLCFTFLVLITLIPAGMALMKSFHVSRFNYSKLNELLALRPMMMQVNFLWSESDQSIYLGLDKVWNGAVDIEIESISGKIIGEGPIAFNAQSMLEKGTAVFKEFYFTRGHQIVEGFYQIKILTKELNERLIENEQLAKSNGISLYGPIYLGKDEKKFSQQLSAFHKTQDLDKKKFQYELVERLNTLSSLLRHLEDLFVYEVSKIKTGRDIERFNARYGEEVAMVMHGVTLDHRDVEYQIKNENSALLDRYNKLTSIGKLVGAKVAEAVNGVKKMESISNVNKLKFVDDFRGHIDSIRKIINSELSQLQN